MANARSGHSNRRSASLPKVCIAASSGGHLEEALCLRRIRELPHFFLTEKVGGIDERLVGRVYYLPQMRRTDPAAAFLFIWGSIKTLVCFIRERPDYVISTGAMAHREPGEGLLAFLDRQARSTDGLSFLCPMVFASGRGPRRTL